MPGTRCQGLVAVRLIAVKLIAVGLVAVELVDIELVAVRLVAVGIVAKDSLQVSSSSYTPGGKAWKADKFHLLFPPDEGPGSSDAKGRVPKLKSAKVWSLTILR